MQSLVAYSQTFAAAQTDVDFPAVADPSVTITAANHPFFPVPVTLLWAYANALLLQRVRISTPRLKPISRPLIRPIEQAASPGSRPQFFEAWRGKIWFQPVEEVQILYTTTTAVAERGFVLLAVGDGNLNHQMGDTYTIRATTAFTTIANAWTSGVLTFDDVLDPGRYQIIGMEAIQATLEGARLIFPGMPAPGAGFNVRPGVIGLPNLGAEGTRYFRNGVTGLYGEFESFAAPQVDCLNSAAVANPEIYLDIVLTRHGARAA